MVGARFTQSPSAICPHAKRTTHIWMADLAGGPPRQITQGDNSESSPAVSPNGKTVAFIRSKDGESNLYLLPLDGGEATQLTKLSTGVADPVWSPDGKWLAFASDVYP